MATRAEFTRQVGSFNAAMVSAWMPHLKEKPVKVEVPLNLKSKRGVPADSPGEVDQLAKDLYKAAAEHWDTPAKALPKPIRRLTEVELRWVTNPDTGKKERRVFGIDPQKVAEFAGLQPGESLSMRQTSIIENIATRAYEGRLSEALFSPEAKALLNHPDAREDDDSYESNTRWARANLVSAMGPNLLSRTGPEIKRDPRGKGEGDAFFYPQTYADSPRYFQDQLAMEDLETVGQVMVTAIKNDDYLAFVAARRSQEIQNQEHEFSLANAALHFPQSAGKFVIAPVMIGLSGLSTYLNMADWWGEFMAEKSRAGKGGSASVAERNYLDKLEHVEKGIVEGAGHMAEMISTDFRMIGNWATFGQFDLVAQAEGYRTMVEYETDFMRPIFAGATAGLGATRMLGMAWGFTTGETAGLAGRMVRASEIGSKAFHAAMDLRTYTKFASDGYKWGVGKILEPGIARAVGEFEAALKKAGSKRGIEEVRIESAVLEQRMDAAISSATSDTVRETLRAQLNRQQKPLRAVEAAYANMMRQYGVMAKIPGAGRFMMEWLMSPSNIRHPELLQGLKDSFAGKGRFAAIDQLADLNLAAHRIHKKYGVPVDEVYASAQMLIDRVGEFKTMTRPRLEKPMAEWGAPVFEALEAEAATRAKQAAEMEAGVHSSKLRPLGEPILELADSISLSQIKKQAAEVGVSPQEFTGHLVQAHFKTKMPKGIITESFGAEIAQLAHDHGMSEPQAAMYLFGERLDKLRHVSKLVGRQYVEAPAIIAGNKGGYTGQGKVLVEGRRTANEMGMPKEAGTTYVIEKPNPKLLDMSRSPEYADWVGLFGPKKTTELLNFPAHVTNNFMWMQTNLKGFSVAQVQEHLVGRGFSGLKYIKELGRGPKMKPKKVRIVESFGDELIANRGPMRRPKKEFSLPQIPGMSQEAIKFQMGMEFGLTFAEAELADHAFNFGAMYDQISQHSPMLKKIKNDATRNAVALGLMEELQPRMQNVALPEGTMRLPNRKGGTVDVPIREFMEEIGKPVEDIGNLFYKVGIKLVRNEVMTPKALRKFALKWMHRQWKIKPSQLKGELERFVTKPADWAKTIPDEARADMGLEIEYTAKRLEKHKVDKKATGSHTIAGDEEMFAPVFLAGVAGDAQWVVNHRALLDGTKWGLGTVATNEAARAGYQRIYRTGMEALTEAVTRVKTLETMVDSIGAVKVEAAKAGKIVRELLESPHLSAEAVALVQGKLNRKLTGNDPRQNWRAAIDVLDELEAFHMPEGVQPQLVENLRKKGWRTVGDSLEEMGRSKLAGGVNRDIMLHPDTAYHLENYARNINQPHVALEKITNAFKQAKIIYKTGPWIRDYLSNQFILGPVNGLHPWSGGYRIAGAIIHGDGHLAEAMRGAGMMDASILTEMGYQMHSGIPGIRDSFGKITSEYAERLVERSAVHHAKRAKRAGKSGPELEYGEGMDYTLMAADSVEMIARMSVAPATTQLGKWIAYQRAMTDLIPRAALFSQELVSAGIESAVWRRQTATVLKKYGLRPRNSTQGMLKVIAKAQKKARKAAYQKEMAISGDKPTAREFGRKAASEVIDDTVGAATIALDRTAYNAIIDKVKKAFVDYSDKSKALSAMTKNPFGPVFATFSVKAIPMVAKWMLQNPVKAYALRGAFDVVSNMMYHVAGGEGNYWDYEKGAPFWTIPMPWASTSQWQMGKNAGFNFTSKAALDGMFFQPFAMSLGGFDARQSPAGHGTQVLMDVLEGDTPRGAFPRSADPRTNSELFTEMAVLGGGGAAVGGKLGGGLGALLGGGAGFVAAAVGGKGAGAPLANPGEDKATAFLQAGTSLASDYQSEFTAMPFLQHGIYKLSKALGVGGSDDAPGFRTGPGKYAARFQGLPQKFMELSYGGDRANTPTQADIPGALTSGFGFKTMRMGKDENARNYVFAAQRAMKDKEEAKGFGRSARSNSPFDSALQSFDDESKDILRFAENRLNLAEGTMSEYSGKYTKFGIPQKTGIRREVERKAAVVLEGQQKVKKRVEALYADMYAVIRHQWDNMDENDWWLSADRIQRVLSLTRGITAQRLREKVAEKLAGRMGGRSKGKSFGWYDSDTEDVIYALGIASGMGIDALQPGQDSIEDIWAEMGKGTADPSALMDYTDQAGWPEKYLRTLVNERKEKDPGNPLGSMKISSQEPIAEE